jgi:hypothetical protein
LKKGKEKMKTKFSTWMVSAALMLIGSTLTPAMADEWNKETRLEIKEPLEIPGKVLTPGTYIFRLANSTDRNIVQVFSEDADGKQKFVTTIFAVSTYRLDTPDKPIIDLEESPVGTPQVIRAWFYPGDRNGWEFVYRKSKRFELSENQAAAPPAPIPVVTLAPSDLLLESVPEPPAELQVEEEAASVPAEEPVFAAVEEPAVVTAEEVDTRIFELPSTAGHSLTEFLTAAAMLGIGLTMVVGARRRTEA